MTIKNLNPGGLVILVILTIAIALPVAASDTKGRGSSIKETNASETQQIVEEILEKYWSESLTKENAMSIHEAFRKAGLRGGPQLDEVIRAAGYDADILKELAPLPMEPNRRSKERQSSSGVIFSSLDKHYGPNDFMLFSPAIDANGELLSQYRCEQKENGKEKSIPLSWVNVPKGAKSLAIVMYHYPHDNDHSHINSYLLLWGIDPSVQEIPYGMADQGDWYMGSNKDGNVISYTSPCSAGPGIHKYTIVLFALSENPKGLTAYSTADINFESFMLAVENTTIVGKAELNFVDKKE